MNVDALDFTSAILPIQFDTFSQEIYFNLEAYAIVTLQIIRQDLLR